MAHPIIFDIPIHPAAEIFPMLDEEELATLTADIKANGLVHPLIVKDGLLIDGRNRREACRRAGIEPTTVELNGQDPALYILSANINRRHLTKGQRAMAVAKLFPEPAKAGRAGDKNALKIKEFSAYNLSAARTVLKWTPAAADAVLAGTRPLNEAYEEAKRLKASADGLPVRMKRLQEEAPDLADLVKEERMKITDAEAALNARIAEAERRRKTFWELLTRTENVLDWATTSEGIEHGREYILNFLEECPIKNPKRTFGKWAMHLQKLSDAL